MIRFIYFFILLNRRRNVFLGTLLSFFTGCTNFFLHVVINLKNTNSPLLFFRTYFNCFVSSILFYIAKWLSKTISIRFFNYWFKRTFHELSLHAQFIELIEISKKLFSTKPIFIANLNLFESLDKVILLAVVFDFTEWISFIRIFILL